MGIAPKHAYLLGATILFIFLGVLGTACNGGHCGGDLTGWAYVGYIGWVGGMVSTCGGILSSQGAIGEDDDDVPPAPKEHYPMHTSNE